MLEQRLKTRWESYSDEQHLELKMIVCSMKRAHFYHARTNLSLERVTTFKYLGIWFSEKGAWDDHTKYLLQRMNQAFCVWYPIFRCGKLPVRVRLMMARNIIYTAVQYCSCSWERTKIVSEKMDVVARGALRVIFKLHPKDVNGEVRLGARECFHSHYSPKHPNWLETNKSRNSHSNAGYPARTKVSC
jgi:hypothetical protein